MVVSDRKKGKILIAGDLSQAETWIVAYTAKQDAMIQSLTIGDIHTETAGNAIFFPGMDHGHDWKKNKELGHRHCTVCANIIDDDMRYMGKKCNHSFSYGESPYGHRAVINGVSDQPPFLTITKEEAKRNHRNWHAYYPEIGMWHLDIQGRLNADGRVLTTCYGRQRTFFGHWGDALFREAYAYEPQSVVSDHFNGKIHPIVGIAGGLLEIRKVFEIGPTNDDIQILNQSHDSFIMEVPKSSGMEILEQCVKILRRPCLARNNDNLFIIPVDAKIGERWEEDMEEVKFAA